MAERMRGEALQGGSKPYSATPLSARIRSAYSARGGILGALIFAMLAAGGASTASAKEDLLAPQINKAAANLPLLLQADELAYDNKNSRIIAKGNVEVYYKNYALTADQLNYDQKANTLNAVGNVRIKEPDGAVVTADRITLTDDFRDGFIRSFRAVTKEEARIAASNAYKEGNTTVFEKGVFTPCKACENNPDAPPLWQIKANKITHKKDEGNVYFEGASFEIFGVPAIYLPYFYYPDPTVKRRSGFLAPEFGNSNDLGFSAGLAYYYSLSPSKDLTVTPVVTTEAGFLLKADWRQRLETGSYNVRAAGVFDEEPNDPSRRDQQFRGSLQSAGEFDLGSFWKWGWDGTIESDDTFRRFYKLDDALATDRISTVYLIGQNDRNYFEAHLYHFGGLTADDNNNIGQGADSIVHPVIDYDYVFADPILGGELSYNGNVLSLSREDGGDVSRVINQVQWRRQFTDPAGQVITPFMQARADLYKSTSFTDPVSLEDEDSTTAFRGQAVAGVEYRYPFVKHTPGGTHVIEPIAQVITRPNVRDQGDIPNEDSQSLIFDDTLLFDTNKFSGYDRLETGTRANYGIQYQLNASNGLNARLVAGQSYHIAGDNPFNNDTGLGDDSSDYVAGFYIDLLRNLNLTSQVRLNGDDLDVKRHDIQLTGFYGPLLAAVNYVNADPQPELGFNEEREEVAALAALKVSDHWSVFGDMRYDLDRDDFVRNSIGIKYTDECFMLSVVYAETNIRDGEIQPDQSILVRYDILQLGSSSNRTDTIGAFSPEAPVIK
jgi:LPS-assembly protein